MVTRKELEQTDRQRTALTAWDSSGQSIDAVQLAVGCSARQARDLVYDAQRKALALELSGYTPQDWMESQQSDYVKLKGKLESIMDAVETDVLDTRSEDGEHKYDPNLMLRVIDRMTNLLKAMDSSLEKQGIFQKKVVHTISHDAILESEEGKNFLQMIMDFLRQLKCPHCGKGGVCDPQDVLSYQQHRARMGSAQFVEAEYEQLSKEEDTEDD